MKKTTLFLLGLMFCLAGHSQEETTTSEKSRTALAKVATKRLQGTPVLEVFGIPSGNIGFAIDSALMTRDFKTLLEKVGYLDSLENAKQLKSTYIDARSLMDTTACLLVKVKGRGMMKPEIRKVYKMAVDHSIRKETIDQLDSLQQDEIVQIAYAPPPPPPPPSNANPRFRAKGAPKSAAAKPSGPLLKVINNSSKNLYLYVEDEYKGIVYAGKEYQLRGVAGCHQVIVESLDQFRSTKKHCFNTAQSGNWVITNN
ncbi:hypothetical protein [Pseudoflavitalea rhizosphaerae]|uniref:hypothetical protein n=1 Tax=Pseudoflavitalea rhizosphaerae TaxID=1884793 RepID=UPI000F8C9ECC|nr:hypothetical protein [Pseudoflavitalea rhizosphaerae]